MGLYVNLYSPIFMFSGLRPYDLGVPELFVVLVGFTVGFAVGVAVAVLVVLAATFGCSSQWKGSKLVFGSTQVGFLQA